VTWRGSILGLAALNAALGLLGLFAPFVVGAEGWINVGGGRLLGVLTMNWAHAALHLVFGIYGRSARRSPSAGIGYLRSVAVVFGILAVLEVLGHLGILEVRGPDGHLSILEIATGPVGTVLHVGLAGIAAGLLAYLRRPEGVRSPIGPPALVGMASGGVIAIILTLVLVENLQVAPWASHAVEGRLHFQTKNVTRLAGPPSAVEAAVRRAVMSNPDASSASTGDWRQRVRAASGWAHEPRHMVALAGEGPEAELWALPGAYWAAFSGAPVVFLEGDVAGESAEATVRRLGLPVYVVAPEDLVSSEVVERLSESAPTRRVAAGDLAAHAVRVARFHDPVTGFGWGRDHEDLPTWYHFVMVAPQDADAAYAALPLARTVAGTLLFANREGGVPAATDRYWWSLRADWAVSPSETSFRHLWVLGDRVTYAAQARMDVAVEKAPYISKGSIGLSGLEGVGIVLIALGVGGFLFVLLHRARLLPEVKPGMAVAWAFTALLLPLGGVLLYLAAHRREERSPNGDHAGWARPPGLQAAAATAMGFGYGAPLMIAIGWAFAFWGFPLFFGAWADGPQYVLGAGMPLMMIGMYVGAVLVAWPSVQTGMQAMATGAPRRSVFWRALGVTALSMAAVSLGMMAMSWFMMMERHPMMMPHEDEVMWIVSLWLASAVGFLVAWPLNWPMVRAHLKSGAM
jgi:hypothetical protein